MAAYQSQSKPGTFFGVNKTTCVVYVPHGMASGYYVADGWIDFDHIEEMEPTPSVRGDVNGDGVVDGSDINEIVKIILGH